MSGNPNKMTNPLINDLYNKCKASNLPELYARLLNNRGGITTIDQLTSFNGYFTMDNVIKDLEHVSGIFAVKIYKDFLYYMGLENTKGKSINQGKIEYERVKCLIEKAQMAKLIDYYYKKHYLGKSITFKELCNKIGLVETQRTDFFSILKELINKNQVYAKITASESDLKTRNQKKILTDSQNEKEPSSGDYSKDNPKDSPKENSNDNSGDSIDTYLIKFIPKILHPSNRRLLIEGILALVLGISGIIAITILSAPFLAWNG